MTPDRAAVAEQTEGCAAARSSQALWTEDALLQPPRALEKGRRLGPASGCDHGGIRRRYLDDRQHCHPGAPAGYDAKKGVTFDLLSGSQA